MMLTEAEAWVYAAEMWDEAKKDFENDYGLSEDPQGYWTWGLCGTVDHIKDERMVSAACRGRMWKRLHLFEQITSFWWTHKKSGQRQRVWACLFLAAMAEAEE
ncbi:MAG: hypothetical protein ACYTEQ_30935 [Planctomycetota bacterium]|jgi:hypothetical protein